MQYVNILNCSYDRIVCVYHIQIVVSLFVAVILDNLELEEDIKRLKQVVLSLFCYLIIGWTVAPRQSGGGDG